MLQAPDPFVPIVPANPEDATDVKGFLDSILAEMTAGAAPEILDTGMLLWRGLAAVLVVWTGLRIAFTGDFRPWDLIRLVIALWIPWSMLNFYNTALPGATVSFPGAVVGGGNWLQTVLVGNIGSDWMDAYLDLARNIFSRGTEVDTGSGLWTMIWTGLASIQSTVLGVINTLLFQVFLCIMALLLLALYAVTMAQVMWAQIALAMLLILGPMFIPFLLIEPLAFLFWGWFKALWTYSLYGAIAAAIMRVFLGVSLGYINVIMTTGSGANDFWEAVAWTIALLPLMVAGILSALMVGSLATQLVGGGGGGGGGLMGLAQSAGQAAASNGTRLAKASG